MSKPEYHAKAQRIARAQTERSIEGLIEHGVSPRHEALMQLKSELRGLIADIGRRVSRITSLIWTIIGLSPGEIKLWFDSEGGFMTEARLTPGSLPIYHYIGVDIAATLLKGEITKELEKELMTPDDYLGE